jgi:UDP-N-acetylmuramoyl-tripeptide--D-alanyl-D-alanine ligase
VVPLTVAAVARAAGGRVVAGDAACEPGGFSIDSRTIAAGDVFFAIVAQRDGHAFVAEAMAKGAAGVVVSRSGVVPAGTSAVIEVRDTTRALQELARFVRRQSGATVVAITGSAGKTTTKEAIAAFVGTKQRVAKNAGNLNNHLGLPLSLLDLRRGADVGVMELGMNHAGEIRVLVGIAEPDVRVWTNVGDAHIGHFGSQDAIADAKAELLEGAGAETVFVGNGDDPRIRARARGFGGRAVWFGFGEGAHVRAVDVRDRGLFGTHARLQTRRGECELSVPLVGRGNLANVLAATAVALELGIDLDAIAEQAGRLQPAPHRGVVRRLSRGITIVDDSYNSSPAALRQALEAFGRGAPRGRRVAVLGEMLELGESSLALHERCGRAAAAAGIDLLWTIGGEPAQVMGLAAIDERMPPGRVRHVATSADAAPQVVAALEPGDVVLVKGSHGIRTDVVVEHVIDHFREP